MTNDIEIPLYKTIIPNEVYERRANPATEMSSGREFPTTQILHLLRLKIPSPDETITKIQESILTFPESMLEEEPKSTLEQIINKIPLTERDQVLRGEKGVIDAIKQYVPRQGSQTGKTNIWALSGCVPDFILDKAKKEIKLDGFGYGTLIRSIGLKESYLAMSLDKERFPSQLELEYLMDRGVTECNLFSVIENCEDYKTISNQIRMLSQAFDSPEKVRKLRDVSEKILDLRAARALGATFSIANTNFHGAGIIIDLGSIGDILKQQAEKQQSRSPKFRYPGTCDN